MYHGFGGQLQIVGDQRGGDQGEVVLPVIDSVDGCVTWSSEFL